MLSPWQKREDNFFFIYDEYKIFTKIKNVIRNLENLVNTYNSYNLKISCKSMYNLHNSSGVSWTKL